MPPREAAFDPAAPTYDADFTDTIIGRWLRARVHARLAALFPAGGRVLELGCGTGEDALYLAGRGVNVTATDGSPAMLRVMAAKAAQAGVNLPTAALDLHALPADEFPGPYDGVFANFGVLNVLADWRPLAGWLAQRVKPGGAVAFAVMAPACVWEIGWHTLHGDWGTALRRMQPGTPFQASDEAPAIPIFYPAPRTLRTQFAPHFTQAHLSGLGLFLPPSDAFGVVEKRPALLRTLTALEQRLAPVPLLAPFADHYWIELRRDAAPPDALR